MQLYTGDCLAVLRTMPDNSVDSIVTDPPYGLSFMGKKWDYDVPSVDIWKECLRVLKPGGHLLSFAGTRTQHRMAVSIEDAGFEIRDMIGWYYFSGFPKSHDISKAIDKAAGAEREVLGMGAAFCEYIARGEACKGHGDAGKSQSGPTIIHAPRTAPASDAAKQWEGWGSALKPAFEPVTMARKPLIDTLAANVLAYGTGGLNIDGCRIARDPEDKSGWSESGSKASENRAMSGGNYARDPKPDAEGRWPANLIHDGALGPEAARFFYTPKASKKDRDEGLESFELQRTGSMSATADGSMLTGAGNERTTKRANVHPTVKPTDIMRYLCRLVTPPGGVVLDPFMGSGSTGKGAVLEGFDFIGIELDPEYVKIAEARIKHALDRVSSVRTPSE